MGDVKEDKPAKEPRLFDELSRVRAHGRRSKRGVATRVREHPRHKHVPHEFPVGARLRTPSEIPLIVQALIAQFFKTCEVMGETEAINDGFCQDFATRLAELLPGAQVIDGKIGQTDIGLPYEHVVVKYHGRYYDAERPSGVASFEDLPWVERVDEASRHGYGWSGGGTDYVVERVIAPTKAFAEQTRKETYTLHPQVSALMPEE